MADESPPDVTARSQDLFAHPRISGGDGSSLDRLVKIDSTGMEMGLMLMQLWLEQALGLKGRDWLPGTERWVDSANHPPRTVRAVGVELRDGSEREYFFELGGATVFGREFRSGAAPVLPPGAGARASAAAAPRAAGCATWAGAGDGAVAALCNGAGE